MTRNFTPTPAQRKEKRENDKASHLAKGEREQRKEENNSNRIRYWTPTFFKPKPHTKVDKIIISLPKPLPIKTIIKRINETLEPLL